MSGHGIRLSRRRFLQVLAGGAGALVVGIRLADAADAPLPPAMLGDNLYDLGAYVRIDADGNVLIGARDPDTGTGVATALPRIIADELDADWNRVGVVPLGLGVGNDNGKPRWSYGRQLGGVGGSIPAAWNDLRQVGAVARWLLLQAAARRLGVPASRLRCEAGTVIAPDGRRFGYGNLAADASKIALPSSVPPLKNAADYRLIGQSAGDVDARAIVTGTVLYAIDHYYGDALVAVLAHCPWPDGTLARIDTTDTLAVPGVLKVVQLKPEPGQPPGSTVIAPAVAVLAENSWAALQGRARLKLEWKPGASAGENSTALEQQATALLAGDAAPTSRVRNDGDVEAAGRKAARRLDATYVQPWLAHATAEPMNCLVRLDKDRASLVVPTQAPQQAWAVVQRLTGLAPDRIDIRVPRVGGGYGRRLDHDYVAEAVLLAKAVNRPVRLLWTRGEDFGHDYYRAGSVHRISATIGRKRQLLGWAQRMASASALNGRGVAADRLWTSELLADQLPAALVPNYRSDWYALQSAMPRGPMRGMPHLSNAFAVESFIDELAHQLREDPLKTRLRILGEPRQLPLGSGGTLDTGRLLNVLKLVADRIEWKNWLRTVNGLGIACWHVDGAYVAHAIEASMQGEQLTIQRVVCAADVGRVINPRGLEGQLAGATLDALSIALNPAITFKNGQVQQHGYRDYPLASMAQLPNDVEVITVTDDRAPAGASFLAMPTAAPALANAVFRASAVRVRRLPLMKELLRLL
ncbi:MULTISPECIES: xanthine dehydrogenase family protein molybdopterin-binding subunit [Rhodanobacter]|uniref:xanthine dehydrogenase family protein molybdopterin-binding subunit n=1 Tax=Rhodanobacter TaxID=75309 RepID=UPI00040F400D|nr:MULTISPECIES: molybdopterin cofactor-binding domain-containing protein [Rhodanobacter]KZC18483.1 aldehyde oxidase [Rhodanobacter denitrificans]UJJ50358.1 molybdopterin-dependent oxidoreductase [Rhodanobacter denitrificans]UJM93074.1 molybdopterin-dependent oxidoreductase [Rhodanobacter denitrificans]UJM96605.1 molybdopterin-dependent oxidoreductase [Rhodanobacter denitrificans]UJN20565.1 molybdopterin-dependent oxidoreductase [Rhodanobacter denitrificans]